MFHWKRLLEIGTRFYPTSTQTVPGIRTTELGSVVKHLTKYMKVWSSNLNVNSTQFGKQFELSLGVILLLASNSHFQWCFHHYVTHTHIWGRLSMFSDKLCDLVYNSSKYWYSSLYFEPWIYLEYSTQLKISSQKVIYILMTRCYKSLHCSLFWIKYNVPLLKRNVNRFLKKGFH
jgi:hypothetical protein